MAHVARDAAIDRLARIVEIMALWLARDGVANLGFERGVIGRVVAQGRAQVGHVFLSEAHVELAGAGEAHAVAAFAEVMRERRDEADLLPGDRKSTRLNSS